METDAGRMDWTRGCWQARAVNFPSAEVVIAGDWAPIRDFAPIVEKNPESIYGNLLPELRDADLRIVNLECPLADRGTPMVKSGTVLKGSPLHLQGLATVPFEVATLANNHIFDFGTEAFLRTRDLLQEHHIHSLGAGLNTRDAGSPLILHVNEVKIGIVNFSEGEDLTAADGERPGVMDWRIKGLAARVAELRSKVHGVVVICHGGLEYIPFPPPYVAEALQRLAVAGADLVIGHHPHVPQGIQIHQGTPICYSLGNFVFFQETRLLYRKIGYLIKAVFTRQGLARIRIVPYEIHSQGLRLLVDGKYRWFLKQLSEISAPLKDFDCIKQAWNGFLSYYGLKGFREEVAKLMDRMAEDPAKGAAMFRNRLTTLQHRHHWIDALTRVMGEKLDESPAWARAWAEAYFTCKAWPKGE